MTCVCHVTELASLHSDATVTEPDTADQECDVMVTDQSELVVKTVRANRTETEPRKYAYVRLSLHRM